MKLFPFFLFLILFYTTNSKMAEEQRRYFLHKLTDKISPENIARGLFKNEGENEYYGIKYDKNKIDEIINKYDFTPNYNYLEEYNIEPIIKNQERCGCCWSHSATTALSYRFKKAYNINVDLSPQDGLSCYIKDCKLGNSILDAQLNLIKNGTVTEGCFHFQSADGITIPECPSECEDGSEFIKYKAKNAYLTRDYYSEDTFYDIVALIMDQLETYGPVISAITAYEDFVGLPCNGDECKDYIYKYDGKSKETSGHAVTIIGFGLEGNRYYWLCQNSWGTGYGYKGFVKIEFGQIGIEQVSFAEAYLPNDKVTPNEIDLSFESLSGICELKIIDSNQSKDWNNSFEVNFEKVDDNNEIIKFICGKSKNYNNTELLKCFTEELKFHKIGEYQYKNLSSLGIENNFIPSDNFERQKFNFYSWDRIYQYFADYQTFFISEKGSKILFYNEYYGNDKIQIQIYSDFNNSKSLKNCKRFFFIEYFISCEIDNDELDYFNYLNEASDSPIVYTSYCGGKISANTVVYRLNKNEYPVFRIKSARMDNIAEIREDTEIRVTVGVEGSISNYNQTQEFLLFGYVQINLDEKDISQIIFYCDATRPESVGKDHIFICTPNIKEGRHEFKRVYFYPYAFPLENDIPYEVIINKEIKVLKGDETDFGEYLKISNIFILALLILF